MDSLSHLPWKAKNPIPVIAKDERLLKVTHRHWIRCVLPLAMYATLFSTCMGLFFLSASMYADAPKVATFVFFITLILCTLVQHWFFHYALSENATDVILTTKRIFFLKRRLWLEDSMDELILQRIRMVEVKKQGIWRRILNYGDLWFDTGGGQSISFVPNPEAWSEDIERHMTIG